MDAAHDMETPTLIETLLLQQLTELKEKQVKMHDDIIDIKSFAAKHNERSNNQHQRIERLEKFILYGGSVFVTVVASVGVAFLSGLL
jgi:hypothetical protein